MYLFRVIPLVFVFSISTFTSFSQSDYDAKDARLLIHKSSKQDTDDELIAKLESFELSSRDKKNVGASRALVLQRYKLAKYMMENGYSKPKYISDMFAKPFSCSNDVNTSTVSSNSYTYDEAISYVNVFMNLGLKVDIRSIYLLEDDEENNKELIIYLKKHLSEKDKAGLDQREFYRKFQDEKTSIPELQKMLDSTGAVMKDDYLFKSIYRDFDWIKFCVENGANVNFRYGGNTPLTKIAGSSNEEKIMYLINQGANICAENHKGKNCYKIAKKSFRKKKKNASEEAIERMERIETVFKEKTKDC